MTLQEVRDAKQTLEGAHIPVSANTILARIGGSKRDVVVLLRQLRMEEQRSVPITPAPLAAAPVASLPVPRPSVVTPACELASFRARYHRTSAAALGTAAGSPEQQDLALLLDAFAQRCAVVRECLERARRLRPLVAYEQANAADFATGTADAGAYAARLAQGTTPRAIMLTHVKAVLTAFVGAEEAARLVATTEDPRWVLHH